MLKGQRVFTCGHSFHVFVYGLLGEMAKSAGIHDHQGVGLSAIGGSRVIQHWDVPEEKNQAKAALRTGKVDVLTLSPIWMPDEGIEKLARLGAEHNPHIRVTVQEFWLPNDTYEPIYPLDAGKKVDHNATVIAELRKQQARYDRDLSDVVHSVNRRLGKDVVLIVPVGQAAIALREKIVAGTAPGLKAQWDLFSDCWGHARPPLEVLAAYCHFAVIYRRSPVGLPLPSNLANVHNLDEMNKLNRLLQELAWDAVIRHPLSGVAKAVEPDAVVPLWPGDGLPPGVKVQNPQNENPDANGLIRRMDKPELRVFLPLADTATGTAVIICPGGGYGLLDYKAHVAEFVADYQQQGIAVIALLYKVPTNADLALTEGQRAIRLVRSHAKQWKLDPQKIGMQGYSAGGHLLVNLISHADNGDPQAKDPLDRLSCRPNFVMLMCPWNTWKVDRYPLKAPLPPVFLACADDDKLSINFSDPLAERLKELQTPVLYWRVHGGGHSAFHRPSAWGKWMEKLLPWLKQQGFAVRP